MIVWISRALALAIHDRQLAEHGGATGIRDEGLLESALARPKQLHAYVQPVPDLAELAAAMTHHLLDRMATVEERVQGRTTLRQAD